MHIEASSTRETLQLAYTPLAANNVPKDSSRLEFLWAFELRTFDRTGKPVTPVIHRPWKLEVPIPPSALTEGPPEELLLARYLKGEGRWLPLVTSFFPGKNLLVTRLVEPGIYAVARDVSPG